MELDELIGEVRREAARRRAAPDFPLDEEAAVAADLDRLGPVGGADLARILARLRLLAHVDDRPEAGSGPDAQTQAGPGHEPERSTLTRYQSELADLTASAVNALAVRLDHLERRLPPPKQSGGFAASGSRFDGRAIESLVGSSGKVLVAGPGASEWVPSLITSGIDAFGVDPARVDYDDGQSVRAGAVIDFLASVASRSFAGVLVVGPQLGGPGHYQLCSELARVTDHVVVSSEAPWSWHQRLGDAGADLSEHRPLSPESWVEGLTRSGLVVSGSYGADGRSYLLEGRASV